jgi:hypothetical protein
METKEFLRSHRDGRSVDAEMKRQKIDVHPLPSIFRFSVFENEMMMMIIIIIIIIFKEKSY